MRFVSNTRRFVVTVFAAGVLVLAAGSGASAAVSTSDSSSSSVTARAVNDGEGPQFYSGSFVDVTGEVNGDVYASGQTVTISGTVTGDVIAAAQTINITGSVDGNVRLAAQTVTISGTVSRSGTIAAATISLTDAGSFGNDVVAAAGDIGISGDIGRDLFAGVGNLTIDGSVDGNVTYDSDSEARITTGAVGGTVDRIERPAQQTDVDISSGALFIGWLLALLYALVAGSLVTITAALILPRQLHRVTDVLFASPWKALLVGFVASVAVPIVLIGALVTIVGAPLALVGLVVWLVLTLATFIYGAFYVGRLLLRGEQHPVVKALLGGAILIVALHVPWLNILVWAAMVWFGLGAQLLDIYSRRPWRRIETGATPQSPADPVVMVDERRDVVE